MALKGYIYIGSDHAGYELKKVLMVHLKEKGVRYIDLGAFSKDSIDYPDIAVEVCKKVITEKDSLGVLICGTGIGMMMTANKHAGIRAAVCTHELMARMARAHNDANVLCLGSRIIGEELAKQIMDVFIETPFEKEERHERRIRKMEKQVKKANPEDCC